MTTALDLVLANMASSYVTTEPQPASVKVPSKKPAKVQAAEKRAAIAAAPTTPSSNAPKTEHVATEALPKAGTLTAFAFLQIASSHNVSWTDSVTPTRHTTPKKGTDREGMIRAIAAYCGWNPALDFGTQDKNARRMAQREVNPALGIEENYHRPSLTIAGLVAGVPDWHQKRIDDLKAREKLAVEAIVEQQKIVDFLGKSDAEKQIAMSMLLVEKERLAEIRKDIANLSR